MTGRGHFIEVQGTGEGATFDQKELDQLLMLGQKGIRDITSAQSAALGNLWPARG